MNLRTAAKEDRPVNEAPGHLFENDPHGFREALEAALSGWVDLRALSSPPRHALSADHDQYTTFFSESPGKIAAVRAAMKKARVEMPQWTAENP